VREEGLKVVMSITVTLAAARWLALLDS